MAVDFACKLLDHLWLECLDGPTPPIINLTMAQIAVKNLLAAVRGHTKAWQRAAEADAVAPTHDEAEAATPTQNEPDVNASTHDAEFSAAPVQDLVIDRDTFTVTYKGIPCFLGNKRAFWLLERLQHARGTFLSIKTLIDDVWKGKAVSNEAVQRQISTLRTKLKAAGIEGIDFKAEGDTYRMILS